MSPALFVYVRRAQHSVQIPHRGERTRTGHGRARALGCFDNLGRRLIENPMIVSLQANSNAFS